ncbi:MAG: thiamine-phosphate pyrophosphorylase [Candidatus Abyssobacteria bacterium SURF_17]|uniref:Thiamine-phosphate pyrophosphorylase n=1 Tax=Candidatus Abyssobacteria bacterium SURF_17 TaxID=2093361 RepID=A0A419EZQ2_9BACT|nr:MAG: thiamine-phosphate pyrophosphorylase [Candidatus Abyssubacteria bacterium SURF_17]
MTTDQKVYRILDANANRAREGLRVVEEYLRFICDDATFTARLKGLRHHITETLTRLDMDEKLIGARSSDTDVGASSSSRSEANRSDTAHIMTANLRRSQEALRVLEEYSKLISHRASAEFKEMRFDLYTIEKDIRLAMPGMHGAGGE